MTANNAEERSKSSDSSPKFDVLLTDIKMGWHHGLQLVEEVKRTHQQLPVIV